MKGSEIKVRCLVGRDQLEKQGESYYCHECSRHLPDVSSLDAAKQRALKRQGKLICGVATMLLASSCGSMPKPSEIFSKGGDATEQKESVLEEDAKKEEIPIPGTYFDPDETEDSAYPVANWFSRERHYVSSPYGGHVVNVKGITAGTLVRDPNYPLEERKYFYVPE